MRVNPQDAKQAAISLYYSIDWGTASDKGFEIRSAPFQAALRALEDVKVLPNSRLSAGGTTLDTLVPSVWHAACLLLFMTLKARSHAKVFGSDPEACKGFVGIIPVFRGQSVPWNIIPSRWRPSSGANRSVQVLAALRAVLSTITGANDAIEFDLFGRVDTVLDAEAIGQHYGVPTNLVDFTFDPMTALHFALARADHLPDVASVSDVARHAVVYWTDVAKMANLTSFTLRLPPPPLLRLYRQAGFFVDFGSQGSEVPQILDFEAPWMWLQQNCGRIFFPREYPTAVDIMFEDKYLLREDEFIAELLSVLGQYDEKQLADVAGGETTLQKLGLKSRPPWRIADDRSFIYTDDEFLAYGKLLESYLRKAPLHNLQDGPFLDPGIIVRIADNDARLLKALLAISNIPYCGEMEHIVSMIRRSLEVATVLQRMME